jgi:small subunit ribosomal protein S23
VETSTSARPKSFTRGVSSLVCLACLAHLYRFYLHSVVKFTLNLHDYHEVPLSEAYATAVAQYRSLRSERTVSTAVAVLEAEAMGAEFGPTEIERGFGLEAVALESWQSGTGSGAAASQGGKQWAAEVPNDFTGPWTRGQEYVARWKEGVTPYVKSEEPDPSDG